MAEPIRLYLVRIWDPRENKTSCRVVPAYTAEDAIVQWRICTHHDRVALPASIEPIADDDPRLKGWKADGRICWPMWFE